MSDRKVALAFTLFIHLVVFGLLVFSWSTDPTLHKAPVVPPHVKATMVETSKQKTPPVAKPTPEKKPAPKPEPKPKPKPKPAPKPAPAPKQDKVPEKKPAPKPEAPKIDEPSIEEMLADEELAMEKEVEAGADENKEQASNADQSDVEVASYTDAISAHVGQRWRIPGNYRNRDDITTRVRIQMIPGGEVINVSVVESSGYPDFDESVMNAVKLSSPLPVPDGPMFNKQFRSLVMEFDPKVAQ